MCSRRQLGCCGRPLSFTVRRHVRWLPLIAAIAAASCSAPCSNMHFERLRETNRAVITIDSHAVGSEIQSPDALAALVNFAETHSSSWGEPWYGAPVAKLRVEFYAGDRFLGDLGVGTNFISAQGCAFFQSRAVSPSDRRKLLALIGVGDPYAAAKK